ncbi:MAG: hypothetical protein KC431_31335, partial [Myxococcales bacterium]|nr:hypothetical protein [Myxococcales bacterium]
SSMVVKQVPGGGFVDFLIGVVQLVGGVIRLIEGQVLPGLSALVASLADLARVALPVLQLLSVELKAIAGSVMSVLLGLSTAAGLVMMVVETFDVQPRRQLAPASC